MENNCSPSHCLECYEKLLDATCRKDENYEPGDDPQKLCPGEIDPNPESKPARPDPVVMDEDEKEMLSEARARLANTRGKKAKRKAREKQLVEVRSWEEIAKMGYASDLLLANEELAEGSGATRALLANFSQTSREGITPLCTPQRTRGRKGGTVMMEAENLARLRESQTPLLGGENPVLHPSDFSGGTPRKREIQTPNPIATTPSATSVTPRFGMTPRDGYSFGMTPKGTPFRDELQINEDLEVQDSSKLELHRQAEFKRNLRCGLTTT